MSAQAKTIDASGVHDGSGTMFDAIASRYDLLNLVMSFGLDRRWRRASVPALRLPEMGQVLDAATGTGDMAIEIARARPNIDVVGLDASGRMLELARTKVSREGLSNRIALEHGDVTQLPFAAASFDGASMAFGIRNVPDRVRALKELARVVRPNGRIVILELSDPRPKLLGTLARFYIHDIIPRLGAVLSRAPEYRYLERSIAAFPSPQDFEAEMERAGIGVLYRRSFAFGSAVMFVGRVEAGGEPW